MKNDEYLEVLELSYFHVLFLGILSVFILLYLNLVFVVIDSWCWKLGIVRTSSRKINNVSKRSNIRVYILGLQACQKSLVTILPVHRDKEIGSTRR